MVLQPTSSHAFLAVRRSFTRAVNTPPPARKYSSLQSSLKISSTPAPHSGSITVVSLNRPRARNALSKQLLSELKGVVDGLHREAANGSAGTRALVLASESDQSFCAGADLKERVTMSESDISEFLTTLRATFSSLAALPIPTLSAVSSTALGGGLELALSTQFRVFASTAVVGLPETRLAIVPGGGGTYRLPALIGETRARDLILTGRKVQGPEAYFFGLCDRLVDVSAEEINTPGAARTKVLDAALQMARTICEGGPVAVRAAMLAVRDWKLGEQAENAAYEVVLKTEDRKEALKTFGEKRAAVFRGR